MLEYSSPNGAQTRRRPRGFNALCEEPRFFTDLNGIRLSDSSARSAMFIAAHPNRTEAPSGAALC